VPSGSPFQIITSRHFFHFYFLRRLRTIGFSGSRLKPFRWCPQPACDTSLHQITSVWFVLRCVSHPKLSNHPGRATARTILIVSKWIVWGSAQRRSWTLGCSNWNPSGNFKKHQNAANLCVPSCLQQTSQPDEVVMPIAARTGYRDIRLHLGIRPDLCSIFHRLISRYQVGSSP
jgi:hypothetical protein